MKNLTHRFIHLVLALFSITSLYAQPTTIENNQIRYLVNVNELWAGGMNADFGTEEEFTFLITWNNGDGEPINGTSCFTCDGDESCLVGAGAKAMFNRPYTDLPSISFIGWEDDNDPRCSFNNDDEWHQSFYDVPPPSVRQPAKWATGFGVNGSNWVQAWMTPFSANWDMRVSTTWRYESGQSFNDPLDFGPVDPNPAGYHYDRNSSANPDGLVLDWAYGNTIGDVAPDVIYKFRLTGDGRVRISTDNGTTDDEFDTRLYLYDEDLNEIAENDDTPEGPAGNRKSTIIKNLCAGTYFIRVSGYNGDSGQFGLRVIYEEGLPEFVLGVNQTDVSCPGGSDGQIAFATVGGLGESPITYTIGGLNESDIVSNPATGLSAGTYTVWAIDQCFNTAGGFEVPIQDGDDNTLPVANCKDITLLLHDSQSSWDFPFPDYLTFITDSYDNCGDFTPTFDPPVIYGSDGPEVTYTMTLTDESGNSSSCTGIITVDLNIPSSVQQDEALDAALQTFPNPASDWLNIQIKNHPIDRGFIYLRDQTGRLLHQVNIESGRYQNWILARVAFPSGSETSHNYVTRIMFRGKEQLANFMNGDESIFPDNIDAVLTEEELDLVNRTEEIRNWVKTELFSSEEYIEAEGTEFGPGMVTVFNYFGSPDGRNISSNEHLRVERAYWMPIHKANIEAGQMSAWVLLDKMLPYGNNEPYHSATVDVYESMSAYLNSSFLPVIEQMHTEAEMNAIFEETEQAASLIRAEIRVELDRVK